MSRSGEPSEDNRNHPRFEVDGVSGTLAFQLGAEVVNISPGGMRVRTTSSLEIGRHYTFRLGDEQKAIDVGGRVVWCRLQSTRRNQRGEFEPQFEAGVAFKGVVSDQADALLDFLRQNLVLDLGETEGENARVYGRFKVDETTPVVVEADDRFSIEKISLSGMRIRSSQSLALESLCKIDLDLGGSHFECLARIINIRELGLDGPHTFQMGVAFLKVNPDQRKMLQEFIRKELIG